MTPRDRSRLIARIRQMRHAAALRDTPSASPRPAADDRTRELERRIVHLEQLVEGLQDSVHRESDRHDRLIGELQTLVEPGAMRAALADDARARRI